MNAKNKKSALSEARKGQHGPEIDIEALMENISQIKRLDQETVRHVAEEVQAAGIPYQVSYGEYQSGGWHTAMLYQPSKGKTENEIAEGEAVPAPIMDSLPQTKALLESLGLTYFSVRIAKTEPDAYLWEHRDYLELGDSRKLRLHIPLVSDPEAQMQFSECSVHMQPGYLWKLDPSTSHAIANKSDGDRIHLILDCYVTEELKDMCAREVLADRHITPLPVMTPAARATVMQEARELFDSAGMVKAEESLMKTFHSYNLGSETSYDLLIEFYDGMGFKNRAQHWRQESLTRMVTRDKLDPKDVRVNMRGAFFQAAYETPDLPQYDILNSALDTCRKIGGLEGAYVRGSLARGDADPLSDIDLLCVVSPEKYGEFIEKAHAAIGEKYKAVLPPWKDEIVKDFGGTGFVHLIQEGGKLYQLDLYVACQGSPGLENLDRVEHKQRIFHAAHDRHLTQEQRKRLDTCRYELHADQVKKAVNTAGGTEDTPEKTMTEMCILAFMIRKCLKRAEPFVAANEFGMWKKAFIKLARQKYDPAYKDYGFYHVGRLKDRMDDDGAFHRNISAMNTAELTEDNFKEMHKYFRSFMQEHYPLLHVKHGMALNLLDAAILGESNIDLTAKLQRPANDKVLPPTKPPAPPQQKHKRMKRG